MEDIRNRADIEKMVNRFYDKVRADAVLGPIFDEKAQLNWAEHLPKMYDFWETSLFHLPHYKGNPVKSHLDLHQKFPLRPSDFRQWLRLFNEMMNENFAGPTADIARMRAESIAVVLQTKLSQTGDFQ